MRKTYAKEPIDCRTCARPTNAPRFGQCFACYQQERRGTAPPAGAACEQCGETDRVVLRKTALGILCANDHARRSRKAVA